MFREKRVQWWLFVLSGVLAGVLAIWLYPRAFPLSGLNLQVSREQAQRLATQFLREMGIHPPRGYRAVTTFKADGTVRAYLEQTLGLREANRLAQREGFAYVWSTRWFRPDSEREYYVDVDPEGRVVFFAQYLPDKEALPNSRQPRQVAEQFLQRHAGILLTDYQLVSEERQPQANRVEYAFTWERRGFRLGEATQRVTVSVSGDQVLLFSRWLKIPQKFHDAARRDEEKGGRLAGIYFRVGQLLEILQLVVILVALVRREIDWRVAGVPAVLLIGVSLLSSFNSIPLWIAEMETGQTWAAFWTSVLIGVPMDTLYSALQLLSAVIAAEYLYRKLCPDGIPLRHWWTRQGIASQAGRTRVALGYWVLAIDLFYTTLFYALGRQLFGVWMHSGVPYDDMMSTYLPWVYSLLDGVGPAFSEELVDRLFVIVALSAVLRSRWVAIALSALLWSLGHCGYTSQPYYIRAVELFPVGVFWGWLVMRYGPLPTIIAHFCYNAITGSDIFLYSDQLGVQLSWGILMLFLLTPALLAVWWGRREGADVALPAPTTNRELDALLQSQRTAPVAEQPHLTHGLPFPSLPRRVLWGAVFAAISVAGVVLLAQRAEQSLSRFAWSSGEKNPLRTRYIDTRQALDTARQHLPQQGKEVRGWLSETFLDDDGKGEAYRYLRKYLGKTDADALWARLVYPPVNWEVHWQKPGTSEWWRIVLAPDGRLWERYCWLPEDAPGEKISPERARQLAEKALVNIGFSPERLLLVGTESESLPHRSYHRFQWQIAGLEVGAARVVVVAEVNGDVVTDLYRNILYPADEEEQVITSLQVFGDYAHTAVILLLALWGSIALVHILRHYPVPWGWGLRLAAVGTPMVLLLFAMGLSNQTIFSSGSLPPAWELPERWTRMALMTVVAALLFIGLSVAVPTWQVAFPTLPHPMQWTQVLLNPGRYRTLWREAIFAQAGVWAFLAARSAVSDVIDLLSTPRSTTSKIPEWVVRIPDYAAAQPLDIARYLPLLYYLLLALLVGIVAMLGWMALIALAKVCLGTVRRAAWWYGVLALLAALSYQHAWQIAEHLATSLVTFVGLWLLHRFLLKQNPLTLFVAAVNVVLLSQGGALLYFERYRLSAVLLLAIAAGILLWGVVSAVKERHHTQRDG